MATRKHIQHIKSRQAQENDLYGVIKQPKLPILGTLKEGEIAINYGEGIETISIENAHAEGDPRVNEIVTFSSDKVLYDVEEAVAAAIADMSESVEGAVSTVNNLSSEVTEISGDLESLANTVSDHSYVTSAALNDLNDRKADKSDTYTKSEVDELLSDVDVDINVDDELSETSENPVQNKVVTKAILDNELVAAAAFNDLNDKKLEKVTLNGTEVPVVNKTANIRVTINGHEWLPVNDVFNIDCATGYELAGSGRAYDSDEGILRIPAVANEDFGGDDEDRDGILTSEQYGLMLQRIDEAENDMTVLANDIVYDSTNKTITLMHGNTAIGTPIDATDFIKDGMVDTVTIDTPTEGPNARTNCLIITFNTDAGKSSIEIPISDIFNANNYYTKTQVDTALSGKFDTDSANVVTSITGVDSNAQSPYGPQQANDSVNRTAVRRVGTYTTADGTSNREFGYWDTTYENAVADVRQTEQITIPGKDGLMSRADKTKLDGIESGANRYVLPAATTSALGGVIVGTDLNVANDGTLSVDKETVLDNTTGASTKPVTTKAVYDCIVEVERVVAASENALEDRIEALEQALATLSSTVESYRVTLEGLIGAEETARIAADAAINDRIDQLHP